MPASSPIRAMLAAAAVCLTATLAQAAGLRPLEIPADAEGPAIHGAIWSPCDEPPGRVQIDPVTLPGVKDCPLRADRLPLVVISHGRGGNFAGHRDTAEALADAGFIVAAISHPGDNSFDLSRSDDLSAFVERPQDVKRLVDYMLGASQVSAAIDRERIGFFGFSRGGYTGLVLIGANPDWARATTMCQHASGKACAQIMQKDYPAQPLIHDPRIKAAIIADPLAIVFGPQSLAAVKVPVQLWASERGGDGVLPLDVAAIDANLPPKHQYRVVPNSGHFAFLAPCPEVLVKQRPELCVDAPGFDRVAFHAQFNADVLAFFRTWLAE